MNQPQQFKVCSICRTPIFFASQYYSCSVSTCNRKGRELFFCSVSCWDAHLPEARHRDAWAELETAPSEQERGMASSGDSKPRRRLVPSQAKASPSAPHAGPNSLPRSTSPQPTQMDDDQSFSEDGLPRDVLVVMSKLKAYIKARGGANTSDGVSDVISDEIRKLCDRALRSARQNERKTVLARDFEAAAQGEHADH